MTSLANAVAAALMADTQIATTATGGVFDHDIRREGNVSSFGSAPGGLIKPTLVVDEQGGGGDPFGGPTARLDYLAVIAFGPDTTQGRAQLDGLVQRVIAVLHRWQKTDTREFLTYGTRLGQQAAPLEQTVMDQLRFTVHGTLVGVAP